MRDAAERATQLYASAGDAHGTARAQRLLAFALFQMGRLDEANPAIEQALAMARACGSSWDVANCLDTQALIERQRGDFRAARELFAQALTAFRALGDELWTATVLSNMAEVEFADGHSEQAVRAVSEALETFVRGKNAANIAVYHTNSAAYSIALGNIVGARESAREGLRLARQVRDEQCIAVALQHLALLAGLGGNERRAAQLLGYEDAQYTALGIQRETTEQWGYDKLVAALRETLSADEIAQLTAEGAAWTEDRAVEEALAV
jgi:tetratricopeptide (TPR) repeat protein